MSILIGADIVPTQSNYSFFEKGDGESLVGCQLMTILNNADYRIFNLETPLSDVNDPIHKSGPTLIAPTSCINGLVSLGIDVVTIANNHILDQGLNGLFSTINTLDHVGISHLGAGGNLLEASKPFLFSFNQHTIGIYACAEHEFSIASTSTAGANPFDPLESFDAIQELKQRYDYLIVLYHGGKEFYRYPSPILQKVCRKFIDKGANLVVCQHSHCIGCEEKYLNGTIVYGQGNFLFDRGNDAFWSTGLLISIDNDLSISYIPIKKTKAFVRLANDNDSEHILNSFKQR